MLLWLSEWLAQDVRAFNVFNYLTLRTVLAALTALMISWLSGPAVIRWLAAKKIGQAVRTDGPQTHLAKSGTPTMGGVLILIATGLSTLLWGDLENRYVWIVLLVTLGTGAVGWYDDWRKVVYRDPKGLASRWKFFWQSVIGLTAAGALALTANTPMQFQLILPFFKDVAIPLGVGGFIVLTYLVIVGTSNAVNLTDGLDGLAIMPVVMVGSALGVFAYVTGSSVYSKYLLFPYIPGAGELLIFTSAMAGAGLAFLWFNTHPAQVFMGDVGALALGAALGTIAVNSDISVGLAPAGASKIAEVKSTKLPTLISYMISASDNTLAEYLARHVAIAQKLPSNLQSIQPGFQKALESMGLDWTGVVIKDGSGESKYDVITPAFFTDLLSKVLAGDANLKSIVDGFPVAGKSGTLASRFTGDNAVARGKVFAKTGSIFHAYALVGYMDAADGSKLGFAVFASGSATNVNTRGALDTVTTAIFNCGAKLSNQ